ncbi:3'(2'),5'-bisphosphate nucleotidase CysQ family protein [Gelidibacter gilvus]|uniref:3'(2'),5'-bisphosphate nucleotidase CysQ n=1 Tax=Gelidibacter gilvus TaxID=59602 RepID=A0A4Q0XDT0_9FLAO|nr:3'(2'),5'-bisphosphate nucleotidase CysQ [Gelidibacter gilvus]RXJ46025.1 3'(2'),5'-bisphosphate nucleotidase CysQ [Gelidibacter gilvus]
MPHPSNLHTAITAALEAGKVILDIYNSDEFEVAFKDDNSPLTKADVAAHEVIMAHLSTTDIPILSEEGKSIPYIERKDWERLWIVDPIDGTKEFIKRNGEFTVNIALIENQKPVLGVIFVPVTGELYFSCLALPDKVIQAGNRQATSLLRRATDGQAIFHPNEGRASSTSGSYKVNVNINHFDVDDLIKCAIKLPLPRKDETFTILTSRSHPSQETDAYIQQIRDKYDNINIISKGSSLKFCLIAEGQADCYPKFGPTMEWDTAAGQAICEQSGIEVVDWETKKPIMYNRKELLNNWFIVQKQKPL